MAAASSPRVGIWRIVVFLVAFQGAQVVARLVGRALGGAAGEELGTIVGGVLRGGGVLAVTWAACRWIDRRAFAELALGRRGLVGLPIGLAISSAVILGAFAIELALGWARVVSLDTDTHAADSTALFLVSQAILFLGVGIAEEVALTGYVFVNVSERWRPIVGAIVTAGLFSAMHFHLPSFGPVQALALFGFSLLAITTRLLTGSLWLAVGWHAGWDLAQTGLVGMSLEPGERTLVAVALDGPAAFVGTPPVIEGGVLVGGSLAVLLGAAVALLRARGPRRGPSAIS